MCRRRGRSGDSGADPGGPGRPARRRAARGPHRRQADADLHRLPGDAGHPAGGGGGAGGGGPRRCPRRDRAVAALVHRRHHRRRPAQAEGVRHRAAGRQGARPRALFAQETVACPKCGSTRTARISEFGSTACKALWRCEAARSPSTTSSASERGPAMHDFTALRSPRWYARRPRPSPCGSAIPEALREAFRFKPGQHLTAARHARGRGAAPHLFDLLRARRSRLRIAIKRVADGRFSNWANDTLAAGAPPRGDAAGRAASSCPRATAARATRGVRRRRRHHADHRHAPARAGAASRRRSFTLVYGNRTPADDPVPRGAGGPEGSLPRPLHAAARALPQRGEQRAAARGPHHRRQGEGAGGDAVQARRGGARVPVRAGLHDQGRAQRAAGVRLPRERVHHEFFAPGGRGLPPGA